MNLGDIRRSIFDQLDWAPSNSTDAIERMNGFINRAYMRISQEAPYLFFEDTLSVAFEADTTNASPTDTLQVVASGDRFTLETNLVVGDPSAAVWETNRSWDARDISLKNPADSTWYFNQIREVWVGPSNRVTISLMHPWQGDTTGLLWAVRSDSHPLPADIIETSSFQLTQNNLDYPLRVITQGDAEFAAATNTQAPGFVTTGRPRWVYRRPYEQLQGPVTKPGITVLGQTVWVDQMPIGSFQVVYTYSWGTKEANFTMPGPLNQVSLGLASTRLEPWLESAPSPASDVVEVPNLTTTFSVQLPNLDRVLGFDDATLERYGRSGVKKRIYLKRLSDPTNQVESRDRYYYLDEVDGSTTTYTVNATVIPDAMTPLREIHGYSTVKCYPVPDQRYECKIRCIRRPLRMRDDEDVPRMKLDAIDTLIYKAAEYAYEADGNLAMKVQAERKYAEVMGVMAKRYGTLRSSETPIKRRPAVVNRSRHARYFPTSQDF